MRLDGAKSSASMLLEMSIAIAIAMPSRFSSTVLPPTCGPAAATIHAISASDRSTGGSRVHQGGRASAATIPTSLKGTVTRRLRRCHHQSGRSEQEEQQQGSREGHAAAFRELRCEGPGPRRESGGIGERLRA